jgi:tryptophan-rich sensory protein
MSRYGSLLLFILLVVAGGTFIGMTTQPGPWYEALQKPWFNPPNWIFGPVWTVLYIMIGIAGWRIWRAGDNGAAMTAWWVQLVLNFAWSPAFFAMQNILLALVVVSAMWLAIVTFMVLAARTDRTAVWLFVPYLAWVSFAAVLNASIYALNG